MSWRIAVVVVCGCAATQPVPRAPTVVPIAKTAAEAPATPAPDPWTAVSSRVMTWTPRGVEQIGSLPGGRPAMLPPRWFVEPIAPLDRARLDALIELVRREDIPGLSLRNQAVRAWLGDLRDLPALEALVLDGSDVDGAAVAALELPLRRLDLAHTAVDDATAAALARQFPALESLDLADTAVGDTGVRALAGLHQLQALHLAATRITDAGGAALAQLTHLALVDLGATRIGPRTIEALRGLPIHELFLDHTPLGREIAQLAPLAPQLLRLELSSIAHRASDRELAWLTGATQLIELGISGAQVHDALASQLAELRPLRALRMAELPITRATIERIAARADLEQLDLADTPVDDTSARAILGSPALRSARLDATGITDAALDVTPGPALRELYVSYTQVTDRGLAILARLPALTALGVGHTLVGDPGVTAIAACKQLDTVVLSHVAASPAALAEVAALPALERLYLDQTGADDTVIAAIASPALRVLYLQSTAISDAALPALERLAALDELTLGDNRLGRARLPAWPRLRTLSLLELPLDDAILPSLAAHASLVTLDLSGTAIHDPSPLLALPRLTTLGVARTRLGSAGQRALHALTARGVAVIR